MCATSREELYVCHPSGPNPGGPNHLVRLQCVSRKQLVLFCPTVFDVSHISQVLRNKKHIVQTVDWDRCKLPVVDTGMRSLGGCPCHDKPY